MSVTNTPSPPQDFSLPIIPGRDSEPDGSYTISPTPGNTDPTRLWSPRIETALNLASPLEVIAEKFDLYKGGIVFKEMQVKAEFSQRMDLHAYPFDKHKLVVTFHSNVYDNRFLNLKLLNYGTSWVVDPWLEGWMVNSRLEHYIGIDQCYKC